MVQINVFGAVRAESGNVGLDLGGPRQRAVLGLLIAAEGRVVSTDRLLDELWQGEPPPKALGTLQVYVSHLRKALEPGRAGREPARILLSTAPGYQLRLPTEDIDLWHFADLTKQATEADPLTAFALTGAALARWNAEPFIEFVDEQWAIAATRRADDLRSTCIETRSNAALLLDRPAQVLDQLDQHVTRHPLREEGVRLLALSLYRVGRQSEALAVMRAARNALADEVGIDPGPALQQLEQAILNQDQSLIAPPAAVVPVAAATPPASRPLIASDHLLLGRNAELAALGRAAERTAEGRAGVFWITGEPGVGKSALVGQFADELTGRWRVAHGPSPEVDGAPAAWAWTQVLRALDRDALDGTSVFELATRLEADIAHSARPVLIVLDDLHRADGETLQVLRHLLLSATSPLLVLATLRPQEVSDALRACRAALIDHTAGYADLEGLTSEVSTELLLQQIPQPLTPPTVRRLVERADGNPLFLRELARLAAGEGPELALRGIPSGVREVIRRRLLQQSDQTLAVLRQAAVLGRDIDVELLVHCHTETTPETRQQAEDLVLDGLDAGVVAGLLEMPQAGRVRFIHALVRDTLYDDLPPLRRQRLHRRVLDVLESIAPVQVSALAFHSWAAMTPSTAARTVTHARQASQEASTMGAHAEAARFARMALEALKLSGRDPHLELKLRRELVDALAGGGQVSSARRERQVLVDLALEIGKEAEIAEALSWTAPTVWSVRELGKLNRPLFEQILKSIKNLQPGDVALRIRLLASAVREAEATESHSLAVELSHQAVELAHELDDPELECMALNSAYFVAFPPAEHGALRAVGERMLLLARQNQLAAYESLAHHILFAAFATEGDFAGARAEMDESIAGSTAGQLSLLMMATGLLDAAEELVAGSLDRAAETYRTASRTLAAAGHPSGPAMETTLMFAVGHAAGNTAHLVADWATLYDTTPDRAHDPYVCALLDAGELDRVRAVWDPELPLHPDYFWLFRICLRAQNACRLGDLHTVAVLYPQLLPWRGSLAGISSGSNSLGPVDYFLGLCAAALGQVDEGRQHFVDAVSVAQRFRAPHWESQARTSARLLNHHEQASRT